MMKPKTKRILTYTVSVLIALAVGVASAWINSGKFDTPTLAVPPLTPTPWLFPVVWAILYTLMGVSAAQVYVADCPGKSDALFIYAVQLAVSFLWAVFYFTFQAAAISFVWLIFLLLLVILMMIRFERCHPGSGKLQIPYLIWLCFAAYLNFSVWMLNQ